MKIDIVRQTPIPPPIDHAVITVSERELRIIATAILRDTYSGMRGSWRLPSSFSESEWDDIVNKMRTIFP